MRVRVVDDEASIARMLAEAIRLEGHEAVITTSDFYKLLDRGPWEGIDVAVLDLMLGEVSGYDILEYIKAEFPDMRVVILSASRQPISALEERADVRLSKPISPMTLVEALHG